MDQLRQRNPRNVLLTTTIAFPKIRESSISEHFHQVGRRISVLHFQTLRVKRASRLEDLKVKIGDCEKAMGCILMCLSYDVNMVSWLFPTSATYCKSIYRRNVLDHMWKRPLLWCRVFEYSNLHDIGQHPSVCRQFLQMYTDGKFERRMLYRKALPNVQLRKLKWKAWVYKHATNQNRKYKAPAYYWDLVSRLPSSPNSKTNIDLEQIVAFTDIHPHSIGQHAQRQMLERLLRIISTIYPKVGYSASVSNIVSALLTSLHMDERLAYESFDALLFIYDLYDIHRDGVPGLLTKFTQLDEFLSIQLPTLCAHFRSLGINASSYSPKWILSLFTKQDFDKATTIHHMDLFFCDSWKFIFRYIYTILATNESFLLDSKIETIMAFLANPKCISNELYQQTLPSLPKSTVWENARL